MTKSNFIQAETASGQIRGIVAGGVQTYRGIRYAQPPIGELRFAAPVRTGAWEGIYDATEFGNRAVQPPEPELLGPPAPGELSEDCLFLNVHTPAADDGRRPVLCWIHGGSYTTGSANEYDGSILAAQGDVVVVTINYRLGVFGFLGLSKLGADFEQSGAHGFLDQIAALGWIRDNIADLGGDPDNVTVFGESAGGGSVLALLASPQAEGLFHKAIAHSAGGVNMAAADQLPMVLSRIEGEGSDIDRLRSATAAQLLDIQQEIQFSGGAIDGIVVTRHPTEAVIEQGSRGVPLIIGSNKDEGTLFSEILSVFPGVFESTTPMIATRVTRGADPTDYLHGLRDRYPDDDDLARAHRVWVDLFRRTAVETAAAATEYGIGGWLYRFDIPTTVLEGRLGATHASEIAFTFNWFDRDDVGFLMHDPGAPNVKEVARRWSDTIIQFARTGDPNGAGLPTWNTYARDRRDCMMLDSECRVDDDPDGRHRQLWSQH